MSYSKKYGESIVRYARGKNGVKVGFLVGVKNPRKRRKTDRVELPRAEFRRVIAENLDKIEKILKTKFLRTKSGNIRLPLGAGYWGVAFLLENGNVLKISRVLLA